MPGEIDAVQRKSRSLSCDDGKERAAGQDVKKFTWEELAELNERHNGHIAIRNKVYDVSKFIQHHPGGVDQIMYGVGRDATQLFESYHKLSVHRVLEKFYVGELITNEYPWFPEPSKFYVTLRGRVEKYFEENNIDAKIDYWMFARYIFFLLLSFASMAGAIVFQDSLILCILCSLLLGVSTALVTMTCSHDSSHFAITHKPWVWKMVQCVHDFYNGASMFCWIHQHILGHHLYTNINGADPDIMTATPDLPDVRRIKWEQKWLPRHFYQHIYVPILYCVLGIKTRFQDFKVMYTMKNSCIRFAKPSWSQWVIFFTGKVAHCLYRFGIPLMFMPLSTVVLMNIIGEITGSYWLALIFQTSHVVSEVDWPKPDERNYIDMDWAEMQVATTQDYATDSWFWNTMTGALNHSITHHLFPGVIQSHYPKITPIVTETCKEFGLKYHYVNTTTEAIGCHVNHLKKLGQQLNQD